MGQVRDGGDSAVELVRPAAAGDAAAMRRLLVALGPVVLSTARKILREPADAEEAAQETMIAIVRDLGSLREPAAVFGFAGTAAARIALRARRRRDREHERRAALRRQGTEERATQTPATALSARERADRLLEVLDQLPPAQAEAIVMRYVLGHEPAEIASATQAPVNTVRSRIRLARAALARQLGASNERKEGPDGE